MVFDENGNYEHDKIVPDSYVASDNEFVTETTEVIAYYSPKLVNGKVVEGLTQDEIDEFKNQPRFPTEMELLKEKVALQDTVIEELMFNIIPELTGGGI